MANMRGSAVAVGGDRCDGCDSGFALLGALREASRFGANKYDTASTSAANAKLNAGVICGTAILLSLSNKERSGALHFHSYTHSLHYTHYSYR